MLLSKQDDHNRRATDVAHDTTRLLGLDGVAVVGVADDTDGPVVHLVTADERARHCPDCGARARRSKGRWVTRPRDLVGRWPPTTAGVGQAPLALRRAGVPASLVQRVGPASTAA